MQLTCVQTHLDAPVGQIPNLTLGQAAVGKRHHHQISDPLLVLHLPPPYPLSLSPDFEDPQSSKEITRRNRVSTRSVIDDEHPSPAKSPKSPSRKGRFQENIAPTSLPKPPRCDGIKMCNDVNGRDDPEPTAGRAT
jgi:hypothetical protein